MCLRCYVLHRELSRILSYDVYARRVFVLIHKMDTVKDEREKENQFRIRHEMIYQANHARGIECSFFMTSIWDETLYKVLPWKRLYNIYVAFLGSKVQKGKKTLIVWSCLLHAEYRVVSKCLACCT